MLFTLCYIFKLTKNGSDFFQNSDYSIALEFVEAPQDKLINVEMTVQQKQFGKNQKIFFMSQALMMLKKMTEQKGILNVQQEF